MPCGVPWAGVPYYPLVSMLPSSTSVTTGSVLFIGHTQYRAHDGGEKEQKTSKSRVKHELKFLLRQVLGNSFLYRLPFWFSSFWECNSVPLQYSFLLFHVLWRQALPYVNTRLCSEPSNIDKRGRTGLGITLVVRVTTFSMLQYITTSNLTSLLILQ